MERMERQSNKETSSIQTIHMKLDIEKEKDIIRKEKENDSLVNLVNKEEKDNSKKSNSLKEEIDRRLKSIERSMTYAQDYCLLELAKKTID